MKKLTGTEKQVAWAEDIRNRYAAEISLLKEAIAVMEDCRQEEMAAAQADPLGRGNGKPTLKYTATTSGKQSAAVCSAKHFVQRCTELARGEKIYGHFDLMKHYGLAESEGPHGWRLDVAATYRAMLADLERAIETQDSAKLWIECR